MCMVPDTAYQAHPLLMCLLQDRDEQYRTAALFGILSYEAIATLLLLPLHSSSAVSITKRCLVL